MRVWWCTLLVKLLSLQDGWSRCFAVPAVPQVIAWEAVHANTRGRNARGIRSTRLRASRK